MRKDAILGHITYFPTLPASVEIISFSYPVHSPIPKSPLITLSSILTKPTTSPSNTDSIIQNLVCHITDPGENQIFPTINVFDWSKHTIAMTQLPHVIVTYHHPPITVRPYHRTIQQRKELQLEVGKLLLDNTMRPSTSPWSSPVISKKKPDGIGLS